MGKGVIVGIIITILVVAFLIITIFVYYNYNKTEDIKKQSHNETPEIIYYSFNMFAEDLNNNRINANYILLDNETQILKSFMAYNSIEQYDKALGNHTYFLLAWNDIKDYENYYFSVKKCELSEDCTIKLEKIGDIRLIYTKDNSSISFGIQQIVKDGNIRNPLICLSWTDAVISANVEGLVQFPIPARYDFFYDKCFLANETIKTIKYYNISYTRYSSDVENKIKVLVIDECDDPNTRFNPTYNIDCSIKDITKEIWI